MYRDRSVVSAKARIPNATALRSLFAFRLESTESQGLPVDQKHNSGRLDRNQMVNEEGSLRCLITAAQTFDPLAE
jgi:hypothetical protein